MIQAELNVTPIFMTEFMTPWLQFLEQHGARLSDAAMPQVLDFEADFPLDVPTTDFVSPLTDLGLIALSGEEAAHFLHNQLTNDVDHLGLTEVRLAGYCSPKGRLLATFRMWRSGDSIILQLPREIQAGVQKRLQMFVLRSKAKLTDVTPEYVMLGLAGPAAVAALSELFSTLPAAPYAKVESDAGTLIREADAFGAPRYQWITKQESAQRAWPALLKTLQPVAAEVWRLGDIHAGIPQITQATHEQFVPQMVNYEIVGGVNFQKGCYPGQEIVARSQYLGKLKRRMCLASITTQDATAGMEVFSEADPDQSCGMIVNAEHRSNDAMDCLVEVKVAMMETAAIHLGSVSGPELRFQALPYALPDPV
jgi:folate-binding protein YgfZ